MNDKGKQTVTVTLEREEADCVQLAVSYVLATVRDIGPEARSGRDKIRSAISSASEEEGS